MTRVVLVGAGHAHLHVIKQASEFVRRGCELLVVAPDNFWYSGLATGMVGGIYPPLLDQVDISLLCVKGGARFIRDTVVSLDAPAQRAHLGQGGALDYDAISLNLGSRTVDIPGADDCYTVKPISSLRQLHDDVASRCRDVGGAQSPGIVIAGGGATACELAGNIARLAEIAGKRPDITVIGGGDILGRLPSGAASTAVAALEKRGIRFIRGRRVERVEGGQARLADGTAVPFDVFVNATGLKPSPLIRQWELPVDGEGAMIVDDKLRSIADPRVHGGGDCVALHDRKLAKIGVYAIRQAPILLHNLLACVSGTEPQCFKPQRNYLLIMNMGDGTGLATWSRLYWHGSSAFWLKDYIDRRFMAAYQVGSG